MAAPRDETAWDEAAREKAYTALCEAVTAAGRDGESLFLARLVLLLGERLADAVAFEACLVAASLPAPGAHDPVSQTTTRERSRER